MKATTDVSIVDSIVAFFAAIARGPIVGPLLEALKHRRTITLLAGLVAFYGVAYIPGLSEVWADRLSTFVFVGTLILSGSFTLEGLLTARAGLPGTIEELVKALVAEIVSPTPDEKPPAATGSVTVYPRTGTTGIAINAPPEPPTIAGAAGTEG